MLIKKMYILKGEKGWQVIGMYIVIVGCNYSDRETSGDHPAATAQTGEEQVAAL